MNDFGVIAISTNKGGYLLVPKMAATFTSSVNPSVLGQPVTFTATMTSIAGPPPDGETVQFVVSGKVYGSATLKGGVAQFTTSAIPVGSHVVVANYSGDANYLPAKYYGDHASGQPVAPNSRNDDRGRAEVPLKCFSVLHGLQSSVSSLQSFATHISLCLLSVLS